MNWKILLSATASLAACSTAPEAPDVEAVRDFIAVAGFERTDQIRMSRHLSYGYVNDYFASATEGKHHYLIEFRSRCANLRRKSLSVSMIDHRRSSSYIRASFDTFRGCPIDKIYSISQADLEEAYAMKDSGLTSRVRPRPASRPTSLRRDEPPEEIPDRVR